MYMSTPNNAWKILTSDTETDVSSYYVTLPDDIKHPTQQLDLVYDSTQRKLDGFKDWKVWIDAGSPDCTIADISFLGCEQYDPDIADKYPTLFDYWVSELYNPPPVVTGLDADYILINLAAKKLPEENVIDLYTLEQKGGDETKVFWFVKIADLQIPDYYNPELMSYTNKFWNETLIAKLIPFTPVVYVDPNNSELQSYTYKPGYTAVYLKDVKFTPDEQGPFQLVYVPPSFKTDDVGSLTGPLIYKINKEYNPNQ